MTTLQKRVASALVLAPPILLAFIYGPPFSSLIVLLAVSIAAWEWLSVCRTGVLAPRDWLLIASVLGVGLLATFGLGPLAFAFGLVLAPLAFLVAGHGEARAWIALGMSYLALAAAAFIEVFEAVAGGWLVLWLLIVVWATDIFAYLVGSNLGGPRLAPAISPKKTWSGLIGGLAAAGACGGAFVLFAQELHGVWTPWAAVLAGIILGAVAQAGDLFESRLKRRFGVKDSSRLIPGHGGLLDRIDGVLAATLALGIWLQV